MIHQNYYINLADENRDLSFFSKHFIQLEDSLLTKDLKIEYPRYWVNGFTQSLKLMMCGISNNSRDIKHTDSGGRTNAGLMRLKGLILIIVEARAI